jgi:hypothetical protein
MIIGLSGYARSGKDTVADYLVTHKGFTRVAFADPIRKILYAVNPMIDGERLADMVDTYGWDITKSKPEVREFLQALGYSARVHINPNVWIMAAFSGMTRNENYVIADVRFRNEANAIKEFGGQIWRIQRPGVEAVNGHVSEWEMDEYEYDWAVSNDGTLEQLEYAVKTRCDDQAI